MIADVIIIACWIGFYLYWIASANQVKATAERQSFVSQLAHRIPVCIAAILLIGRYTRWHLGERWLPDTPAAAALGVALVLLGLAAAIWSRRVLGTNWSSAVTLKEEHELIQEGPYHWVRNPIYTSMLLMFVGTAVRIGRLRGLLAAAFALLGFWIKLKQEERFLFRQFPQAYPAYRRRVKALVPFLF